MKIFGGVNKNEEASEYGGGNRIRSLGCRRQVAFSVAFESKRLATR